jgi:hypothetical protein
MQARDICPRTVSCIGLHLNIKASTVPYIKRTILSFHRLFCALDINFNAVYFYQYNPEDFHLTSWTQYWKCWTEILLVVSPSVLRGRNSVAPCCSHSFVQAIEIILLLAFISSNRHFRVAVIIGFALHTTAGHVQGSVCLRCCLSQVQTSGPMLLCL